MMLILECSINPVRCFLFNRVNPLSLLHSVFSPFAFPLFLKKT